MKKQKNFNHLIEVRRSIPYLAAAEGDRKRDFYTIDFSPSAQQQEYDSAVEAMRQFQPQLKQLFSAANFERFRKENYKHLKEYPRALYLELRDMYFHALFFPDAEITSFFVRLGFLPSDLKWFVPLEKLTLVLDNIASQSPLCRKHLALEWIRHYLLMKLSYKVQRWAGYHIRYNGQRCPIFYKEWRNFLQRRKGKKKNPFAKMSAKDAYIEENIFQAINAVYQNEKRTAKYILAVAYGKINNDWFKRINDACFPGNQTNENGRALFPLYQLIAKDYTLRTEDNRREIQDAFEDTKDLPYRGKRPLELARGKSSVFESF